MKSDRRDFLRITGLTGIGLAGGSLMKALGNETAFLSTPGSQVFNMSGFAAPRLETVRIGFIGLGNRGPGHVRSMSFIEGVDIRALCDVVPEEVEKTRKLIEPSGFKPVLFSGDPEGWKKMCERNDIDLVYICTPWNMHAEMCIYAMEHGKHVAVEVPAAVTMDECWQLVETSEKTRKHCMMMENCCYDFFELLTLNMARQGFFGDIVHGEGAYIHNLLGSNFNKKGYWEMWRLEENSTRRGNLYPTHGLGPICQIMDINRGDRMNFLVSVMSRDFQMNNTALSLAETDPFYKKYVDSKYRGNMTTTYVLTEKGRTIMIHHDVTSPNV